MATRPIKCDNNNTGSGFTISNGSLVLDNGNSNSVINYLSFSDLLEMSSDFSKSTIHLQRGSCYLLSKSSDTPDNGYSHMIAIRVDYPASTVPSKKYIEWTYKGDVNVIGELMILSGSIFTKNGIDDASWDLGNPNSSGNSGGIYICNPHVDIDVTLEILTVT